MMTKIYNPFPGNISEGSSVKYSPARAKRVVGVISVPKNRDEVRQGAKLASISKRSEMYGRVS